MIERRFIRGEMVTKIPIHLLQSVLTLRALDSMTNAQALTELNNVLGADVLSATEQADLLAISTWINAGALNINKIERWFQLEAAIMAAYHGGPLYGTEVLLKAKLETLIGGTLG